MVALGNALSHAGPAEGREGDLPGSDRLGMPTPQVADDAQVVGAAAGRGYIPLPARNHHGLREVVRRLVDPPADERRRPSCIESATLDHPLVPFARLV